MPDTIALPDLVARIKADAAAGPALDSAVTSLVQSFARVGPQVAVLAAGITLVVFGLRSMYENYTAIEASEKGLSQSVRAHNSSLGTEVAKSTELAKAEKDLASARHELALYDLEHHGTAPRVTQDLAAHQRDLKKVAAATTQLAAAQGALEVWDLSHAGHVISAAQLRQREQRLQALQAARAKLTQAQQAAGTIASATTAGSSLSDVELARRQDILDKMADSQRRINEETSIGQRFAHGARLTLDEVQASADKMIAKNKRFVSSQSQVYDGYAKLIRGGLDLKETDRVMNDAIDLSALKHISLSEAVDILNAAEHGRMRGLIDLGITTKQLTDANGNLLGGQKAIAAAMHEVDTKVAHGRDTIKHLDQMTNKLSNDWQELSRRGGPAIEAGLGLILDLLDEVLKLILAAIDSVGSGLKWLVADPRMRGNTGKQAPSHYGGTGLPGSSLGPAPSSPSGPDRVTKRAGGGTVLPHGIYRVGEEDEELLVMGARGGYVMPNSGSGRGRDIKVEVDIPGVDASARDIATEVGWQLRKLGVFAD